MSDWREVQAQRDVWKCITTELGERSVMITSTTVTLALRATVLDSGLFMCLRIIKQSNKNHFQQLRNVGCSSYDTNVCKQCFPYIHQSNQRDCQSLICFVIIVLTLISFHLFPHPYTTSSPIWVLVKIFAEFWTTDAENWRIPCTI